MWTLKNYTSPRGAWRFGARMWADLLLSRCMSWRTEPITDIKIARKSRSVKNGNQGGPKTDKSDPRGGGIRCGVVKSKWLKSSKKKKKKSRGWDTFIKIWWLIWKLSSSMSA